jgi:hypothetical protein
MLDLFGPAYRSCDGFSRRSFLKVGFLGLAGLTLGDHLRLKARAAEQGKPAKDTAVILIYMGGGPSHIDTYDLKPDAPVEFRGEFKPIHTTVQGVYICEHMPRQARLMEHLAIVRSVAHNNAGHGMGTQWMMTGYVPSVDTTENQYPSCGSITAKMRGANAPRLPPYVCLPDRAAAGDAAYLGAAYNPFTTGSDPNDSNFQVRDLKLTPRVDLGRFTVRRQMLKRLDTLRRDVDAKGDAAGYDHFYRDAYDIITSTDTRKAFDLGTEDARLRDRYGRDTFGQSCLLARRLVQAGVTFVTISTPYGWDTHANNFETLKSANLPGFDRGVASLVEDLYARGLDKKVLVVCYGEFGRTPRVNGGAGRDHWPGAMSVLLACGGLKTGQVVGSTDPRGEAPKTRPLGPQDVLATMYHVLGIDYRHTFYDAGQRPIQVCNEGKPIEELI